MKDKNINFLRVSFVLLFLLVCSQCYFSPHYRKCKIFKGHNAKQISQFYQEKVPFYNTSFYIQPLIQTRKPLVYTPIDYLYHDYIGAGGSGQVYIVEDLETLQPKVIKRFFKQKIVQFQEENFIMHRMNYSIQWMKDYLNGIPQPTDYQKDVNEHEQIPTMAIYPFKESLILRDVEFFPHEAAMIFYKILMQLSRTHQNSIIHNDLKMGNVMINSLGNDFKFFEAQLIDWNLATYYYYGLEGNAKKGTVCYYSPQQLMRANHITPAIDVWALAVVIWTFFTEDKPFFDDCKQNNLKAIASLVGIQKLIQMRNKYHYPIVEEFYQLLEEHAKNPRQYKKRDLRRLIPENRQHFFTDDLIDVFERMLTPDPEQRITITELINHRYFKNLKKLPPMFQQKRNADKKKNK